MVDICPWLRTSYLFILYSNLKKIKNFLSYKRALPAKFQHINRYKTSFGDSVTEILIQLSKLCYKFGR